MNAIKNNKQRIFWTVILVPVILIAFPFVLNWLLQLKAFTSVIGTPETWLSFWAAYVGAILTALMVVATFITIRKTSSINKAQWRIDWLNSFRSAAAELIVATDSTAVGQMAQDIQQWRFEKAVDQGHNMEVAVKRCSFLLSSVLKEYDVVFDAHEGSKYIDTLNKYLTPFYQKTGELIQFAIICKYLKDKSDACQHSDGINALKPMIPDMSSKEYFVIRDAIQDMVNGENMVDVIHDAVVMMQQNFSAIDMQGLEKWLLRISSQNAKVAYGMSVMSVDEIKKFTTEN